MLLPPCAWALAQLTKSWAQGNTVLIGDACHPMMPNLGQGGCQAMEDGYVLTEMLKEVGRIRGKPQHATDVAKTSFCSHIGHAWKVTGFRR